MPTWVAGTRNPAKINRLRSILPTGIELVAPPPDLPDVPEDTGTTLGNAVAKVLGWSAAMPGLPVIGTDGGLLVPALGDRWDPVLTARFLGAGADDRQRQEGLLALAAGLRGDDRRLWWQEGLAVARDGQLLEGWEIHTGPGLLVDRLPSDPDPEPGFWVQPLWAELDGVPQDAHWREMERVIQEWVQQTGPEIPRV